MSDQSEENARFVTCPCQHCNGPIEFDANEVTSPLGAKVSCPHCSKPTWLFEPDSQQPPSPIKSKFDRKILIWTILAGSLAMLFIGLVFYTSEPLHQAGQFFGITVYSILGLVLLCVSALAYFLPTIIAWRKKKANALAICVLNLFLGWTFIGWVVALIWAVAQDDHL